MKKENVKAVLLAWRERIAPAGQVLLEHLFTTADVVMLEYADKAENNAVQAKFFQGQRELRSKQRQVVSLFHDNLSRELFQFMAPAQRANAPGAEVLSLVSKDTFERSLAIQTISDQALKNHKGLYYALSQRLGVVIGGPAIPYEKLPAGPHQLAGVFERSAQMLNVERQVLLALYTLFEREVIRESPPWHEELNESLRKSGILPNLKYEVKIQPGQARPADARQNSESEARADHDGRRDPATALPEYRGYSSNSRSGANRRNEGDNVGSAAGSPIDSAGNQLGDQLLGRIRELLTARRSHMGGDGSALRPDPVTPAPAREVAAVIGSPQVQNAVVLPETGVRDAGVRQVMVTRALLEKLRVALEAQRAKIKETVGEDKLSHFDEDTIDIVGMLFEVMLNDDRLTNTVKALLSHLHTPYLKLAVRDRAFLKRREHPARRLFDNMIEAGSRWVDERDLTLGVYPKLQRVVDLIVNSREHSMHLLLELDEGLSADIKLRSERQQAREVRTVETEKGKARLEEAREEANRATQKLLASGAAPADYQTFMTGAWTDYLTLLYLRSNGDTNTGIWRGAMDLSRRLRTFVDGFATGAFPSDEDLRTARNELEQRLGNAIPHYEAKVEHLFDLFSADHEVTIVSPSPAVPPSTPASTVKLGAGGETLLRRLPQLPAGTWVVFHKRNEADQIVKLSWFNRKTERFMFVDQAGAKALVVPLRELANQIDRERAHVLLATGASYVESSLERAVSTLEKRI